MKQCTAISVWFFIRKTRLGKSGETPILMRITCNGQHAELNTQRKILPSLWDQSKERATGKSVVHIEINKHLESLRAKTMEIFSTTIENDGYASPVYIKETLLGKHKECKLLFEVFEEHNSRIALLVGTEYNETTLGRYRLCLKYLREMLAEKSKVNDIPLKHLNGEMIRNFETFLKIKKKVAQNTMIRYMKCLKKVTNLAIANGWITVDPFAGIKFSEKKVVKDFLTIEEVNTIRSKEFGIERLDIVRDIFVFCCYTGLAFIDVYNLKPEHITEDAQGRMWIHKQRQKTEIEFFVPLLDYPQQLIKKYKGHPLCKIKGTLFPVYANQKMNSYLKEIADFCGIKKHLTMHVASQNYLYYLLNTNELQNLNLRQVTI